jgi:hypothetical protein
MRLCSDVLAQRVLCSFIGAIELPRAQVIRVSTVAGSLQGSGAAGDARTNSSPSKLTLTNDCWPISLAADGWWWTFVLSQSRFRLLKCEEQ